VEAHCGKHERIVEGRRSLEGWLSSPRAAEYRETKRRLKTLSKRQRQILDKIVAGTANKAIAFDLGLSEKTVETHRSRLMRKLGAASLPDLVRMVYSPRAQVMPVPCELLEQRSAQTSRAAAWCRMWIFQKPRRISRSAAESINEI
jgi:DNA-binding NarL/FixJ family response regulator